MKTTRTRKTSVESMEKQLLRKITKGNSQQKLKKAKERMQGYMPDMMEIKESAGQLWVPDEENSNTQDALAQKMRRVDYID